MYTISHESLNVYVNFFNKLAEAKLDFDIEQTTEYVTNPVTQQGYHAVKLRPRFKNVKDLSGVANIWQATRSPFATSSIDEFTGFAKLYNINNAERLGVDHYKSSTGSVKFYAQAVLRPIEGLYTYLITKAPVETAKDGHTTRAVCAGGDYYSSTVVYLANEDDQAYNYIDQGHILISKTSALTPTARTFVTDVMTLDMNYIVAAFSVYPEVIDGALQNGGFLPSKDCRITLLKLEKKIPAKLMPKYQDLKQRIQDDFSKNTCNVMIGKLTRKESPFVDINSIRITPTKAIYTAGNVSIEAKNLAEVVFQKLNPNEEWDIFTLINIYTDWVEQQFKELALNDTETGFQEAKHFEFKINEIPIKVAVSKDNTRRSINGHLINVDELSPVMKRAGCYLVDEETDNKKDFERFVTNVARHSLKIRDVWANGLPVKTVFIASDRDNWRATDATNKHPKLRFVYKDKRGETGFYLQVNIYDDKDTKKKTILKTNEFRIGKFAEFVKKVQTLNRNTNMGYTGDYNQTHEGGWVRRDCKFNTCAEKLCTLLTDYTTGLTDDDKKALVGSVNFELSEAEKKSEEMLQEACKLTGTKAGERAGHKGYVIPGKLRNYFVEEDTLKVYDNDPKNTNAYFCVVNKGEQGVGRDALVSRIFALHNDSMLVKQITTLTRA